MERLALMPLFDPHQAAESKHGFNSSYLKCSCPSMSKLSSESGPEACLPSPIPIVVLWHDPTQAQAGLVPIANCPQISTHSIT